VSVDLSRQPGALPVLPWRIGLALLALLLAAVFLLALPPTTLWRRALQDAGHGPVFAGIAIVLLLLRPAPAGEHVRSWSQYRGAFVAALVLGVLTELAQRWLPGRSASLQDVLHDAAGAALGLCLAWWVEWRRCDRTGTSAPLKAAGPWVLLVAMSAVAVLAWQPLQVARAYAARHAAFPTLLPLGAVADASFATAHRAVLSHGPLPPRFRREGDSDSIRLDFAAGARPGLRLFEPAPDWRAHQVLAIDLTNPGVAPVFLTVRVLDSSHDWTHPDRFNQQVEIPPSTRVTLRLSLAAIAESPRGRRMDLAAIADLMLFAARPVDGGEFFVTRIWLE
jgi:hypothetical protein